jgi:hypothetical protein
MGFIPIFITLGGFVFLFVLLVNYNLNSKRKTYFSQVEALKKMLNDTYPEMSVEEDSELKAMELQYREKSNRAKPSNDMTADAKINSQFAACKMARFQYQQLRETKPYFFVAKIFGHTAI